MSQIKTNRPPDPDKQTGDVLTVSDVNELTTVVNTNAVDFEDRYTTLQPNLAPLGSRLDVIEGTSVPILSYTDVLPESVDDGTIAFDPINNNMMYHKDGNWYRITNDISVSVNNFAVKVDTGATTTFKLPLVSGKNYSFEINWGDGNIENVTSDTQLEHDYGVTGIYTITMNGYIPGFIFNLAGDFTKLIEIVECGGLTFEGSATGAFGGCTNLTTIDDTTTFKTTGVSLFKQFYRDCNSLTQIPLMDTTSGDDYNLMFRSCNSLTTIPDFDFGSPSVIKEMFFSMINLTTLDNITIDTSNVTDFTQVFFSCQNLQSLPVMDLSNATKMSGMYRNCRAITSLPTPLDTSKVTNMDQTFRDMHGLSEMPVIDTSLNSNFLRTWRTCYTITSFPQLDTSLGDNFQETWFGCSSLTSFPALDLSNGENFIKTWNGCSVLESFDNLGSLGNGTDFTECWTNCHNLASFPLVDVSSGTNFSRAWQNCRSFTSFPQLVFNQSGSIAFDNTWQYCWALEDFPEIDFSNGTTFIDAWVDCNLNMSGTENILKSLVDSNLTNLATSLAGRTSIGQSSWTTNADPARDAQTNYEILTTTIGTPIHGTTGRGWTLTVNP